MTHAGCVSRVTRRGFSCRPPRGMTLLELIIATSILSSLIALALLALNVVTKGYTLGAIQGDVQDSARRGVEEIAQLALDSSPSTIQELPALTAGGSPVLTFRKNLGYKNGAITYGNLVQIKAENGQLIVRRDFSLPTEWAAVVNDGVAEYLEGEQKNGADDNGNGLIDEPGLFFVIKKNQLTIYLTLEKKDTLPGGKLYQATVSTTVQLRN